MFAELTTRTEYRQVVINGDAVLNLCVFFAVWVEPAQAVAAWLDNKDWPMIAAENFVNGKQAMTQTAACV